MLINDHLRIIRIDDRNVVIEKYLPISNSKCKKFHWKREGFYSTVKLALESIIRNDMLINMDEMENIKWYLRTLNSSVNYLIDVLESEKELFQSIELAEENERLKNEIESLKADIRKKTKVRGWE